MLNEIEPKSHFTSLRKNIGRAPLFLITSRCALILTQYLIFCNPCSFLGHLKDYISFQFKSTWAEVKNISNNQTSQFTLMLLLHCRLFQSNQRDFLKHHSSVQGESEYLRGGGSAFLQINLNRICWKWVRSASSRLHTMTESCLQLAEFLS